MGYYSNVNADLLARMPLTARHVLEIGCGEGALARACLAANPLIRYVGVERDEAAARRAAAVLRRVVAGDVEAPATLAAIDHAAGGRPFDAVVCGDVLEHLRDPWRLLAELFARTRDGGVCLACLPNVAHWSVVRGLLAGRFDYADDGLLDRTHLRFFTLETAAGMLTRAGWTVCDAYPRVLLPEETEAALADLLPLAERLDIPPDRLRRDLSAAQWVLRAVKGPAPAPLRLAGLGLAEAGGLAKARLEHPLRALGSLPGLEAVWGEGDFALPGDGPGVCLLDRLFLDTPEALAALEAVIARGWTVVMDMDDDPDRWPAFAACGHRAFRAVHAVTVATEALAARLAPFTPVLRVFPNAVPALADAPAGTPKHDGRFHLFFGAVNREADWRPIAPAIAAAVRELADRAAFTVVHDRAFYDMLPDTVAKTFQPTLPYEDYLAALAACDIALLPLAPTPFNRCKSDLKLVECCAAGAVPICSPTVYAERPEHHRLAVFAETPDDWHDALLALCADPAGLARRRAMGLAYVKRTRMQAHQVAEREAFYRWLLTHRDELETQRRQRLQEGMPPAAGRG